MNPNVPSSRPVEPPKVRSPNERMDTLFARSNPDVDSTIPIRRYFNSSKQISSMANTYFDEKNFERAFILYNKYVNLFIIKLPKHPQYMNLSEEDLSLYKKRSSQIIEILELIKNKKLLPSYKKEYEKYLAAQKSYEAQLELYNNSQKTLADKRDEQQSQDRLERFQRELDRRKRQLSEPAILPGTIPAPNETKLFNARALPSNIDIDALPEVSVDDLELESSSDESEDIVNANDRQALRPSAPPHPNVPDRSTKPTNLLSDFGDRDELTKMIVPFKAVVEKFMNIARSNTARNVETCAILAGKLCQNSFTITHLLVPKQVGTSDTCSATNEEELFMEQEKLDLLTIGWIHTHPTQNAFLSSVDLHTHAPYQKMLPEAIAIVVAPKFDEIGLYSLSEYGLEFILKCKQTGFHPHPNESQIYGTAGHLIINDRLDVKIVDLR